MSLGGRIVLLNAMINVILVFYLSFFKDAKQGLEKDCQNSTRFLAGSVDRGRKLCWVKWRVVCKQRMKGGLRARDVRLVNLSLLVKWR